MQPRYCPTKCSVCGKWFLPNKAHQKCCSQECRIKRNREQSEMRKKEKRLEASEQKEEKKKRGRKKRLKLNQIIEMARQEGLSYGEYVAKHGL